MASNLSVAQIVNKWSERGQGSVEALKAGVNAVTEAPGAKAAAQKQVWLQRIQQSADKWAANTGAVTLAEWKQSMLGKGVTNMQNGYANGKAKFQRFMAAFLPFAREVGAEVRAMPRGTLQQSIDRARRVIERFHAWGQQGGGIAPMPRMVG